MNDAFNEDFFNENTPAKALAKRIKFLEEENKKLLENAEKLRKALDEITFICAPSPRGYHQRGAAHKVLSKAFDALGEWEMRNKEWVAGFAVDFSKP